MHGASGLHGWARAQARNRRWPTDDALLVPSGDADALAAALIAVIDDPERRAELGRAAATRADRFDARRAVERQEADYLA